MPVQNKRYAQRPEINLRGRVCVLQTGVRARELLTPITSL